MPIYEYACDACGHRFEQWQKITAGPVTECPACHASRVERLISLSSFALKGGGWYATDYGRSAATGSASTSPGDGKDAGKDAGKDTGKESKAESTSPAKTDATSESKDKAKL